MEEITITKVGPHHTGVSKTTGKPYTLFKMTGEDGVIYTCWPNEFKKWTSKSSPTVDSVYKIEADDPDSWGQRKITSLEPAGTHEGWGKESEEPPAAPAAAPTPAPARALPIDPDMIKNTYEDVFIWSQRMLNRSGFDEEVSTDEAFYRMAVEITARVFREMMRHGALSVGPNDATPEQLQELEELMHEDTLQDEPKEIARTIIMGKGKNLKNRAADLISECSRIVASFEPPPDEEEGPVEITDDDIPF